MSLSDLPTEILSPIIDIAVLDAGVHHAAKLRLVNRFFDNQVLRSYASTRLFDRDFSDVEWEKHPDSVRGFITKYLLQRPHAASEPNANFACLVNYIVDELLRYDTNSASEQLRYEHMHTLCGWRCGKFRNLRNLMFVRDSVSENTQDAVFVAAAYLGRMNIIQEMLQKPEVNVREMKSEAFGTPMNAAIQRGHYDIVRLLLQHGVDVNQYINGRWCSSSLEEAILTRQKDIVDLLLQPQYNLNTSNKEFEHAIVAALERDYPDLAQNLLNRFTGSISDCRYLLSAGLRVACRHGMVDIVKRLLHNGGDPNEHLSHDRTYHQPPLLAHAAWKGQDKVLRLLLERGADVEENGDASVLAAAWGCHISALRILLEAGLDKASITARPITILTRALNSMKPEAGDFLRFLLDSKLVDVCRPHEDSYTPEEALAELVGTACAVGCIGFLQVLRDSGIDLDDGPMYECCGYPPPIVAAKSRRQDKAVEYLLSIGVKNVDPLESVLGEMFKSGDFPVEPGPTYECPMPNRV